MPSGRIRTTGTALTAGAGPATPRRCANGASGTPTTSPHRTRGGARSTALSIRCRRARAWSATNHSRADRMRWFVARVAGVSESSSSDERGGWPNRSEAGRTHPPDGPSPWWPPPIRANRPGRSSASDDFFDRARAGAWFGPHSQSSSRRRRPSVRAEMVVEQRPLEVSPLSFNWL